MGFLGSGNYGIPLTLGSGNFLHKLPITNFSVIFTKIFQSLDSICIISNSLKRVIILFNRLCYSINVQYISIAMQNISSHRYNVLIIYENHLFTCYKKLIIITVLVLANRKLRSSKYNLLTNKLLSTTPILSQTDSQSTVDHIIYYYKVHINFVFNSNTV